MNRMHLVLVAALTLLTLALLAVIQPVLAGEISGKVKARGVKNSGDAVIYIDKISGKTFPPPKEHSRVDQKNLTFIPHVIPVLVGPRSTL